eukprot:CAMPEP_0194319468 /NCGR_PEP_ID=MMETSP0171-20130528/15905_1 /TAXON_ID=218684 /ORGANISM="Corethron pennatum, Strain L29A3" /LENGTH=379 /DNA_ID=CAMNT_0039076681 /DNA_START=280 /DNA_END=1419 /DNA_ORIENTATION=+
MPRNDEDDGPDQNDLIGGIASLAVSSKGGSLAVSSPDAPPPPSLPASFTAPDTTDSSTCGDPECNGDNDDTTGAGASSENPAAFPPTGLPVVDDGRRRSLAELARKLSDGKLKKILVLSGAGISCSAGIPDFRTPGTGLYDNLQKYDLPFAEAVFDLDFYRRNPRPFVSLARELWPRKRGGHKPTLAHCFLRLLERKGLLLRAYTQNIDGLEVLAGVSEDKVFECHGHFRTASCIRCGASYDGERCRDEMLGGDGTVPRCQKCTGYVKPDIVFFGESLPGKFFPLLKKDIKALGIGKGGLMIVMGTSLEVNPVASIPNMVRGCSRLLLNRECVGNFVDRHVEGSKDLFLPCDCDDGVRYLCQLAGWEKDLDEIYNRIHS